MEEIAATDEEVHKARERFRLQLARAEKLAYDIRDPAMQQELLDTPPHLLGRR